MRRNSYPSYSTLLLAGSLLLPLLPAQADTYTGYYVNPQAVPPGKKPNCSQSMQDGNTKAQGQGAEASSPLTGFLR